jgi:hypothetical protein
MRVLRYAAMLVFLATSSFAAPLGPFRIQISPANSTVVLGVTQQLTAKGAFLPITGAGGRDLASIATWQSSNPAIASVDAAGVMTAHARGTVVIRADSGPFHGSTEITVIPNLSVTSLAVSPVTPSVANGLTSQFTATATYSDASTQDVTAAAAWGSSNLSIATIDDSGLARTHTQGSTTISAGFGAQSDSTSLTVTAPVTTNIYVTPTSTTIPYSSSLPFTAIATWSDGTAVDITATATWTSSNAAAVGVDSSGVATGLQVGGSAIISAGQNGVTGSGTVAGVTFSNASLNGQYAFSFRGSDAFNGLFVAAGSFQADGRGHLSSGVEDLNYIFDVFPSQSLSGAYTVGPDGRGTMAIDDLLGFPTTFNFVLTANGDGVITQFDTLAVASGTLRKQDPAAFNSGALNGPFAFSLSGFGESSNNSFPMAAAGQLKADGAGNITSGEEDENLGGNVSGMVTLNGSYSVPDSGRGQVTLHDSLGKSTNFAMYMICGKEALLVSLDSATALVGAVTRQSDGLGTSTLLGDYVFSLDGLASNDGFHNNFDPFASVGVMHADGLGTISNGKIDINGEGTFTENLAFSGSYSADSAGRGQATLTISHGHYVFYLISPSAAYFLNTDSSAVLTGIAEQQTPPTFSTATLHGNFDFIFDDGLFATSAISGQFAANGSGTLSGTEDDDDFGNLTPHAALSGKYSIDNTGRGTADMTSHNGLSTFHFYVVSDSQIRFVEKVPSNTPMGLGQKQF